LVETLIWFIAGLAALIAGAEFVVRSASKLAGFFGVSRLVIGLTIVAFGTSAPELAISLKAGLADQTDLMMGNIVGSNITNILLILGITALVLPLKVNTNLIRFDVPVMIAISILLFFFALSGSITFIESAILAFLLLIYLLYLGFQGKNPSVPVDAEKQKKTPMLIFMYLVLGVAGLILLINGAGWLVDSAIVLAQMAGVSELVIGLTIVALGTSLPEVVTSLVAAVKGERDIAVGSVVGSNILNILAVLGVSGLFIPEINVQQSLITFDLWIMLAVSFACLPIFFTGNRIARWEGFVFLGYYIAYLTYLFLSSAEHDALGTYNSVMLYFVIPITVMTVIVILAYEFKKRWRFRHFRGFGAAGEDQKDAG
jgi:cation:H+ antiporter